jgi:hypothetical protein
MNKYFNKKVIIDGIKFDSRKEAKRYTELKLLKRSGHLKELELQKVFELQHKYTNNKGEHIRAITYKCDFFYYDNKKEQYIVEDVKGSKKIITEAFKIKKKLFEYKYGIEIKIII